MLSTFINLPFTTKTFFLSIFKCPLKTGFTAYTDTGTYCNYFTCNIDRCYKSIWPDRGPKSRFTSIA